MECAYSPWRMGDRKLCIFGELFRKNFGTMARFKDRRSIRKYSRRGIPEGLIEALAGEASRAATMGNMQLYSPSSADGSGGSGGADVLRGLSQVQPVV